MTKEQEIIVIEELEQLIEKSKDLSEEEFYTIFTIHEVQNIATVLYVLKEKDKELEKKNKMINELAPRVYLTKEEREEMKKYICTSNKPKDFSSFVKQYFKKKVEERK